MSVLKHRAPFFYSQVHEIASSARELSWRRFFPAFSVISRLGGVDLPFEFVRYELGICIVQTPVGTEHQKRFPWCALGFPHYV